MLKLHIWPSARNLGDLAVRIQTSGTSSVGGLPRLSEDTFSSGDRLGPAESSRRELCRASDTTETASPAWRAYAPIEIGNPPGPLVILISALFLLLAPLTFAFSAHYGLGFIYVTATVMLALATVRVGLIWILMTLANRRI